MQLSIETTTQSSSIFTASFGQGGSRPADGGTGKPLVEPAVTALEAAAKKAEEDAVVIAALQAAVEKGRSEQEGEEDDDGTLASIEDYQQTAGKLKAALGEENTGTSASVAYESASISTTTIEAEIGGETISAEFISIERVSFNSETGLSVRTASAASIEGEFDNGSFSYQSAAVSSLYAGTGEQVSNLAGLVA